jgi:hypothetical protein
MNDLVADLPDASEWTFSGGSIIDDFLIRVDEYSILTPAHLVTFDVAVHSSKLERALPHVESSIGLARDVDRSVLVQAQMLAHKKPDSALSVLESYLSPDVLLPPLLAAFAVELYRYHKPAINCAMAERAKTRYGLLDSFVHALLLGDDATLDEVARKWPQMT